ncbi:Ig-like domain-containing protein [Nocardioides sp. NPDC092400]|uniref:beta strand repeat-containing protein n=1 Tax=Nocardioides sp. NPDC092400 TaxID=3155196 RepID=UPI003432802E
MNSSGIKRGLAVSAISALAVAGIPALATSASAAPGDVITVGSTGPARNAGAEGAVVVLNTRGIDPADLDVIGANLTDSEDNANQDVAIVGTPTIVTTGAPGDTTPNDGLDQITVRVAVTTPAAGATANFAIFEDEDGAGAVDATEARAQVSIQTAGAPTSLEVTPGSQTAPAGTPSAPYSVTVRDAAGRATQLATGETIDLTSTPGGVTFYRPVAGGAPVVDASITAEEARTGTASFLASAASGQFLINLNGPGSADSTATLDVVTAAAGITPAEFDVVSEADSYAGFGDRGDAVSTPNAVDVRVDQTSVRIDIRSAVPVSDARKGATVLLNLTGTGVTFGGRPAGTVSTVLDQNGVGSLTITPDAGTIQVGDTIRVQGSGIDTTLTFARAALTSAAPEAQTYVAKAGGSVDITVTARDQFNLPIAGAAISAQRAGANNDAQPTPRKVTDANGKATFTFTDARTTPVANTQDTVTFRAYADAFVPETAPSINSTATIRYTAEGLGQDFTLSLDGVSANGTAYNPANTVIVPLTDGVVDTGDGGASPAGDEVLALGVLGGDAGAPATVTVDNGGILLRQGETTLPQGSASESIVLPASALNSIRVAGTKSGLTTVTVTSGGRTKTAQFTVAAQNNPNAARNVSVSGPAEVPAGTQQITYTAVVTDAFGNGVAGVPIEGLNVQVSGPGELQDSEAVTDAQGQINLNVRTDDNAQGAITIDVQGRPGAAQFGAAANQLTSTSTAGGAQGLPASSDRASATTTVLAPTDTGTGGGVKINPGIDGESKGKYDFVTITVARAGADATVKLFRVKNGVAKRVKQKVLGADGVARFKRADLNGSKATRYYAVVGKTVANQKGKTRTIGVK